MNAHFEKAFFIQVMQPIIESNVVQWAEVDKLAEEMRLESLKLAYNALARSFSPGQEYPEECLASAYQYMARGAENLSCGAYYFEISNTKRGSTGPFSYAELSDARKVGEQLVSLRNAAIELARWNLGISQRFEAKKITDMVCFPPSLNVEAAVRTCMRHDAVKSGQQHKGPFRKLILQGIHRGTRYALCASK